jgi:maleate cis-trans isomerase
MSLNALRAKRLALFDPPWFPAEVDQRSARYFPSQGFKVIHNRPVDLPSDQQATQPSQLYECVTTHTLKNAEAVFIGGNGFRAIGIIKAPEEKSQPSDPDSESNRILASPCPIRIGRADRRLRPNIWPQTTGAMKPLQCSRFDFRCWH